MYNFLKHMSPCKQNLTLSHQVLEKLWSPNSCFINSKVAQIHNSPFQNIFLMLYPNGTLWVNYRVRIKGPCAMDLTNFPMDIQTCHLIYESFNYNNQEVRMRWNPANPNPVYPIGNILLPDFNLMNIQTTLVVEVIFCIQNFFYCYFISWEILLVETKIFENFDRS
ncbi:unnamed protein product [Meloidogyne enterolobii]|uniref:Uncharacterized protein n=1 Tax=Meloidogyne enterolobii TaxID=390850 RepID=A0ACB0XQK4_MELEN